jgi:diguanylate cyclase (GGDEF)-like protein
MRALPAAVVILALVALGAIITLESQVSAARDAQLKLANMKTALTALQFLPFQADPQDKGSADLAGRIAAGKRHFASALRSLWAGPSGTRLDSLRRPLRENYAALRKIYEATASGAGNQVRGEGLVAASIRSKRRLDRTLATVGREYESRASGAEVKSKVGSAATIALLVLAFIFLYLRASRARSQAEELAQENGDLASTDALTRLGNRRALIDDLLARFAERDSEEDLVLALFDLDGFKHYNDTFGHPAGDSLLARLGGRLLDAVDGPGTAYRMGGDEFCVLARLPAAEVEPFVERAADALAESGEGFRIESSFGLALLPGEASSPEQALQLADRRMYADKAGRSSASRQSADVLLEVINERSIDLREHIKHVALQAVATAEKMGVPEHQVAQIGVAAELHDIGKAAIPDTILHKPTALDEDERQFIQNHTVIGERIMLAAPSLAPLAPLVRSSHERFDGGGYPDGIRGSQIPRGAAIIAVCDAFDAMVGGRPYRDPVAVRDAIEELGRCAGSQFDPEVVTAFLDVASADLEPAPVA